MPRRERRAGHSLPRSGVHFLMSLMDRPSPPAPGSLDVSASVAGDSFSATAPPAELTVLPTVRAASPTAAGVKGFSELCARHVVLVPTAASCPPPGAALMRITASCASISRP